MGTAARRADLTSSLKISPVVTVVVLATDVSAVVKFDVVIFLENETPGTGMPNVSLTARMVFTKFFWTSV